MGRSGRLMRARGQQFVSGAIASLVFAEACRPGVANALTAELVASGLSQPLFVTAPRGDNTHIYIVQQTGQIFRLGRRRGWRALHLRYWKRDRLQDRSVIRTVSLGSDYVFKTGGKG
jgi:hypothetical protein